MIFKPGIPTVEGLYWADLGDQGGISVVGIDYEFAKPSVIVLGSDEEFRKDALGWTFGDKIEIPVRE